MGFWAGIKHALNSTLGTAKFKPLDRILKESMYLVASDTPLYVLEGSFGTREKEVTFLEKTFNVNGTVRFIATPYNMSSYCYVKIYKNNTLIKTVAYSTTDGLPATDITVEKGSVLKLTVYVSGSGSYVQNVRLCGFVSLAPDDGIFLE